MRNNTAVADGEGRAVVRKPRLLSLRETMVLADITEREKDVRNDITHGILPATNIIRFDNTHLYFEWPYVLAFAAAYGNKHLCSSEFRRIALEKIFVEADRCSDRKPVALLTLSNSILRSDLDWYSCFAKCDLSDSAVSIDNYLVINIGKVCEDVKPRVRLYATGLDRVEEKDEVLGGAAVFRDSRVSVLHIGEMAERGVNASEIMEDYNLSEGDVEFAKLYYRARPPVGRPRGGANKHESFPK